MPVELLDIILIILMLVSGLLAMIRGFSREVLSISSWVIAGITALAFYKALSPTVAEYTLTYLGTDNELIPQVIAGVLIFIVVLIIVSLITLKIADFIVDSKVGALDRTLGFLFGAVRGFLLVMVFALFAEFLFSESVPNWVTNAKSKPLIDSVGESLINAIPDDPWKYIQEKMGVTPEVEGDAAPEGQDT